MIEFELPREEKYLSEVLPPIDFEPTGPCGEGVWVVHITHRHGHDHLLASTLRGCGAWAA
jgi:hypothetical protein